MSSLFAIPEWFFVYDLILELLFAVITILVSFYAWKIYKISGERNIKLFSLAFLFIASSYVVQTILNAIVMTQLDDDVIGLINLQSIYHLNLFGLYVHSILFLIGLLLLAYIALRIYSLQTFVLMFMLVFISLYFSPFKTFLLYLLSTILLGFIVYYYLGNYWQNRKTTALLVLSAMVLLFVGYMFFTLAFNNSIYYVFGHVLELIAYFIVLVNLVIILRVGTKKHKNGKKA